LQNLEKTRARDTVIDVIVKGLGQQYLLIGDESRDVDVGLLGNQEIRGCEHVLKSWIDKHGPTNIFMMYDSDKLSQYLRQDL